jgi:thioesterase domain-containing protein
VNNSNNALILNKFKSGMDELSVLTKENVSSLLEKLLIPEKRQSISETVQEGVKILDSSYTETEYEVAKVFASILGLDQLSIYDDFFKIGGNSIQAIQLSHQISEILTADIKVADVFRLKSVHQLVKSNCTDSGLNLVKPYYFDYNPNLLNMIFIHPGGGGSEVYQDLADSLIENFNCIGIDSYNIHNKNKISSLNKLANLYLSTVEQKYKVEEPINLVGWSLGGRIALEMANILEIRGYKKINVILLDTQVPDEFIRSVFKNENIELYSHEFKNQMLESGYNNEYVEKVASSLKADFELFHSKANYCLKYTQVQLFRAIQEDTRIKNEHSESKYKHYMTLKANNVDLLAQNVEVIDLDCHHGSILETKFMYIIKDYLLINETKNVTKQIEL